MPCPDNFCMAHGNRNPWLRLQQKKKKRKEEYLYVCYYLWNCLPDGKKYGLKCCQHLGKGGRERWLEVLDPCGSAAADGLDFLSAARQCHCGGAQRIMNVKAFMPSATPLPLTECPRPDSLQYIFLFFCPHCSSFQLMHTKLVEAIARGNSCPGSGAGGLWALHLQHLWLTAS